MFVFTTFELADIGVGGTVFQVIPGAGAGLFVFLPPESVHHSLTRVSSIYCIIEALCSVHPFIRSFNLDCQDMAGLITLSTVLCTQRHTFLKGNSAQALSSAFV